MHYLHVIKYQTMFSLLLHSSLRVLRLPPIVQKHAKLGVSLIGHSKWLVGVSVDGWLCLYVGPAMNW